MGFMSFLFGSKPKDTSYHSKHTQEADDLMFGKMKDAMSGVQTPDQTPFGSGGPELDIGGKSSWGFGNPVFNKQYNPYQYSMPTALDAKKGLFGTLLGNTNREVLRNQNKAVDDMTRSSIRAGTYSPAMMKNTILGAQKTAGETMGDYGTKTAMDLATETAKAQQDLQQNQAAENQAARNLNLEGGKAALAGEQAALGGQEALNEEKMKNTEMGQNYFMNLMNQMTNSYINPYTKTGQTTGGSQGALGSILGLGAGIASKF